MRRRLHTITAAIIFFDGKHATPFSHVLRVVCPETRVDRCTNASVSCAKTAPEPVSGEEKWWHILLYHVSNEFMCMLYGTLYLSLSVAVLLCRSVLVRQICGWWTLCSRRYFFVRKYDLSNMKTWKTLVNANTSWYTFSTELFWLHEHIKLSLYCWKYASPSSTSTLSQPSRVEYPFPHCKSQPFTEAVIMLLETDPQTHNIHKYDFVGSIDLQAVIKNA